MDAPRNACRIDFIAPNKTTNAKNSIKGTIIWNTLTGRYLTYVPTASKNLRCLNSTVMNATVNMTDLLTAIMNRTSTYISSTNNLV